jgi:hypothetical protein
MKLLCLLIVESILIMPYCSASTSEMLNSRKLLISRYVFLLQERYEIGFVSISLQEKLRIDEDALPVNLRLLGDLRLPYAVIGRFA